jgi:tripartite-type tricarboxylate transporter receptor subunit TctC
MEERMLFKIQARSRAIRLLLAAVCLAISSLQASAEAYPSKAITFVVPYPPGGASDIIARLIAQRMGETFKQPVVVENRAGANGIIALSQVGKAAPDGYTILMTNIGPSAINPSVYSKLPYDAVKDFSPVTLTSLVPLVMVASPSVGINSVGDLIAKAKAAPGALSYAASGNGTAGHLAMELFKTNAGIDIKTIGYKGDIPALQDVMAGRVAVMFATVLAASPHIQSGRLKALAVTTANRINALPNVPTVAETGMPGFEAVSWGGVMAPAQTPKPIIDKLHDEINRILATAEFRNHLSSVGAEAMGGTPEQFQTYLGSEIAKWAKVAKAANIKLD